METHLIPIMFVITIINAAMLFALTKLSIDSRVDQVMLLKDIKQNVATKDKEEK